MVESTALEMRHTGNRIVGSNPTLSAIIYPSHAMIIIPLYVSDLGKRFLLND